MGDFGAIVPGQPVQLRADLQLVLAPNPSAMTGQGTNTYLVGTDSLAVIDPGPDNADHLDAVVGAIAERPVSHIIVTHSHLDHSPLAARLSDRVDAPVLGFGDTYAGRSAVMTELAEAGMQGGGEGLDHAFQPDEIIKDGDQIKGDAWALAVHHTPGHLGNHVCLQWDEAMFVGDLVMGWSTSLVSPPDGDIADFLESCHRLKALPSEVYYSGHGAPITAPKARLEELIAHRDARTDAILTVLATEPATVDTLVGQIYLGLATGLHAAAARNVFAHLVMLVSQGQVAAEPALQPSAIFALKHPKSRTSGNS